MAADSKVEIELELRKEKAEQILRQFEERAAAQLERLNLVKAKYEKTSTAFVQNQLRVSQSAYDKRVEEVKKAKKEVQDIELQIKVNQESKEKAQRNLKEVKKLAEPNLVIDLELRKEQAERRLREYTSIAAEQLERLQKVQARYESTPTAFIYQQLRSSTSAYARKTEAVREAREEIDKIQIKLDEEDSKRGGRLFGIAVNKQLVAFAKQFVGMYLGRELVSLGFAAMYSPEGSDYDRQRAQESTEGAISGAMIGAAFGPIGIAAGAATGAILGLANATIKLNKEIERNQLARSLSVIDQQISSGRQLQNEAFEKTLQYYMKPQRVRMLQTRLQEVQSGEGGYSIKSLTKALETMEEMKQIDTPDYKRTEALLQRAMSEQSNLQRQLFEESTKTMYRAVDPSSITDQYAKQGLYTGRAAPDAKNLPIAGIDFKELNNPVITELRRIRGVLDKISSTADKNIKGGMGARISHEFVSTFSL